MIKLIKLKGIGSENMPGRLIKGVAFEFGNRHVSWDYCALPIYVAMILGLDFPAVYHGMVNNIAGEQHIFSKADNGS